MPIGYVGVVVSYYGRSGQDLSGQAFRHGERVAEGERGVQEKPLGPGKYAFNTYAGNIVLVPTTNFVLHWVTGRTESHRYDESLRSIDLVTKDAYEPTLPLSVVVHIDYQKAPNVIQRFGDVKKLITQTLDPMLSATSATWPTSGRCSSCLQDRDSIQHESSSELGRKFHNFDIECVDVLIGKPDTEQAGGKIETLLEQLRLRSSRSSRSRPTRSKSRPPRTCACSNEAQAQAQMQTQLSNSMVQIKIAENEAEAQLARARKQAEQVVVTAEAESEQRILAGRGEGARILQEGFSEASVLLRKISSFSDPRLYALDGGRTEPRQVQPAAGARASLHLRRRRRGRTVRRRTSRNRRGRVRGQRRLRAAAQHARGREIRLPAGRSARDLRPAASSPSGSPSRRWKRSRKPSPPARPRRRSTTATARHRPMASS